MSANQQDLQWTDRILRGDPGAWNQFVERYSDRVWRRAWQLCNEACPYNQATVYCVFHALAADRVKPVSDDRPSCDEGLEIYAFIFEYLYNRQKHSGKLKHYDGRAGLDAFVGAVLHGHLRTDWIRHKRKLRVDQITLPPEIQRLSSKEQRVFEQMVMQRPTETIARNVSLSMEDTEMAQEKVTHALMANGNLHLILRNPEGVLDETFGMHAGAESGPRIVPLQRSVDAIWDRICTLIRELPEPEKILLNMAFDKELGAKEMLARVQTLQLALPVTPRTGNLTIHSVYQSIDAVLRKLGKQFEERFAEVLSDAYNWLDDDSVEASPSVSVKGLKALLKNMGVASPPHDDAAAPSIGIS